MEQNELQNIIKLVKQHPYLLLEKILEKQKSMKLTTEELVVLQYIWIEIARGNVTPSNSFLAEQSCLPVEKIQAIVVGLMQKEVIHLTTLHEDGKIIEEIDSNLLIARLFEVDVKPTATSNQMKDFVKKVENEFSRKLSPIEIRLIEAWIYDEKIDYEMLNDALRETVLAGVKNFKYMDAILKNWKQNGKQIHIPKQNTSLQNVKNKKFTEEEKELVSFDWISSLGELDD